jgi:uncharacterized membrane protein
MQSTSVSLSTVSTSRAETTRGRLVLRTSSALYAACLAGIVATSSAAAWDNGITTLGPRFSGALGVSGDGNIVVGYEDRRGYQGGQAVRWNADGTRSGLPAHRFNMDVPELRGVTDDGSIAVGSFLMNGQRYGFYSTASSVVALESFIPNAFPWGVDAWAVTPDGSSIVGEVSGRAALWRRSGSGYAPPLDISKGTGSVAKAVSANGLVIVGWGGNVVFNSQEASVWTWDGSRYAQRFIGFLPGGRFSYATGVSGDGSVVVGGSGHFNSGPEFRSQAFRWTGGKMDGLGYIGNDTYSYALGISRDGNVIVGSSVSSPMGSDPKAFRWTRSSGMQTVEQWLADNGVAVNGQITAEARATNSDGSVVVGITRADEAFIARYGSGLLVLNAALSASLGSPGGVTQVLLSGSEMLLNGAHSLPLSYRTPKGQATVWSAGDYGWYNQNSADGNVWLGEIGGGYNFGPVQFNLSVGYSQNRQDLTQGGNVKAGGTYLFGETLIPVYGSLWGVLSGYYQWGNVDIARGYSNAGNAASSTGSPDTNTWALRARLEWDGLADLSDLRLNPYGEVSFARAKMDAYSEASGAFPAHFRSRTDNATDLRIGVNGAYPLALGNRTALVGLVEGVHRFQGQASAVSGELLGPGGFSFNFDGPSYDQNWFRAGIGVESTIAGGKAFFMVNGATRGETPSVWVSARYQLAF